jgi:biotin carboxylase
MVKLPKTEKIKSMPKSFDSFPCVVKPLDLWGSQGVSFADSQAALSEAIGYAQASQGSEEVLISEYVEGDEYSLESISFAGIHYPIAITRKITSGPPHFVELEHHLPSGFPDGIREKLYAMASLILETLKHRFGASHIEFKLREDEIIIMEVAGRMAGDFIGSHLIPLYTGYDYLKGAIDVSLGSFSPPDISKDGSVGIVFESETNASLFQELRGKKEIPPEIVEYTFDEEMSTTALSSSSERGSYFIYKAEQANPII